MATINNKLIHFKSKSDFNSRYKETTNGGETYGDFLGTSIVFIQDAKQIWTHGQFYDANETTLASLGITATAAELNKLDGVTATAAELNYVDGVTSNIQTQLNGKAATSHNHNASNINAGTLDITRIPTGTSASTVALGNHTHSGYAASSHTHGTDDVTALTGYTEGSSTTTLSSSMNLNAALASLQNQIQAKVSSLSDLGITATAAELNKLDGCTATVTELNYVDGVTSNIQTQLNGKAASSHTHTASQVSGLATVATSGSYNDLTNKPSIPTAVTVDSTLSSTSTNPVQNKVINSALAGKAASSHTHTSANITDLDSAIESTVGGWGDEWAEAILSGELKTTATNQITALTGYTEGSSTTTLTATMSLNAALASLQNQIQGAKYFTGTSNSPAKLYLVGGNSQSNVGVRTYSNSLVYTQAGRLYATQMNATNGFYETSDARLKNFKDDIKALDVVSEIPTKYFTWKKDETDDPKLHIGTSAQEIQKLYPDLVTENEDGVLSVDYARLSVIALAAIKELKAELETIKKSK